MTQSKGGKPTRHAAGTGKTGNANSTLAGKSEDKRLLERIWV
jgi:hypothetical protein